MYRAKRPTRLQLVFSYSSMLQDTLVPYAWKGTENINNNQHGCLPICVSKTLVALKRRSSRPLHTNIPTASIILRKLSMPQSEALPFQRLSTVIPKQTSIRSILVSCAIMSFIIGHSKPAVISNSGKMLERKRIEGAANEIWQPIPPMPQRATLVLALPRSLLCFPCEIGVDVVVMDLVPPSPNWPRCWPAGAG